jgi:hypothetical protein
VSVPDHDRGMWALDRAGMVGNAGVGDEAPLEATGTGPYGEHGSKVLVETPGCQALGS